MDALRLAELFDGNDPLDVYTRLRDEAPLHQVVTSDGSLAWLVTRYADVKRLLADERLSLNKANASGGYTGLALPPALDANLLNMDPPDHSRIRRLVTPAFTLRKAANLEERITTIADGLLSEIRPNLPFDLMAAYAIPLPIMVISDMLGIPAKADLRRWTTELLSSGSSSSPQRQRQAVAEMSAYFASLIATKRREPADDLLSTMIAARDHEDRLTDDELLSLVFLILFAGFENSANLIGNSILALALKPRSVGEEDLEALVREECPVTLAIRRFPLQDVDVAGARVEAGATVLLAIAAANRRPGFAAPGEGLAFGHGGHYCLGAPLAKIELQVALHRLAARFGPLALARPVAGLWQSSWRMRGLRELPVVPRAKGFEY